MLTLIESYLVIGGAALLLGFGGSRWTTSNRGRIFRLRYPSRNAPPLLLPGTRNRRSDRDAVGKRHSPQHAIRSLRLCLGIRRMERLQDGDHLTTVCSNAIPVRTMLDLVALSIVFAVVAIAIPYTAASIVSGTVGSP